MEHMHVRMRMQKRVQWVCVPTAYLSQGAKPGRITFPHGCRDAAEAPGGGGNVMGEALGIVKRNRDLSYPARSGKASQRQCHFTWVNSRRAGLGQMHPCLLFPACPYLLTLCSDANLGAFLSAVQTSGLAVKDQEDEPGAPDVGSSSFSCH